MLNRKSKRAASISTAQGIIQDPQIRRAAAEVVSPMAQLSLGLGKRLARRRARRRIQQLNDTLNTARALVTTYGPQVVEQLGLVEAPKPKRTAPRFIAGAVLGAGMMYLIEPRHRRQVQSLVGH